MPVYHPGKERATRAELRCPDPACNPYLTFAALLHAGLEGIEKGYELPPPMETNLYDLTHEERVRAGIESLPETLGEAIELGAASELLLKAWASTSTPATSTSSAPSGRTTGCRSPRTSSSGTCRCCERHRRPSG